MKRKGFIALVALFLAGSGAGASYLMSRRAFLNDFDTGVRAYLTGRFSEAEAHLTEALRRRPKNREVRRLLVKVLMEEVFSRHKAGDLPAARAALARATELVPLGDESRGALRELETRLAVSPQGRPQSIDQMLASLSRRAIEGSGSDGLREWLSDWTARMSESQEQMIKRFWQTQEEWLSRLEKERRSFQTILMVGLFIFAVGALALVAVLARMLNLYFGRGGVMVRLLEDHYHRVVAALPAGSVPLLGPPPSQAVAEETRRIEAIEAELVDRPDPESARRLLKDFLEGEDPWVRARAAKVLYAFDNRLALDELRALVNAGALNRQWPGLWALTELATVEAIDVLRPLVESSSQEVQQATIRSLIQMQARSNLPPAVRSAAAQLLQEARTRTGWII